MHVFGFAGLVFGIGRGCARGGRCGSGLGEFFGLFEFFGEGGSDVGVVLLREIGILCKLEVVSGNNR